MDDELDSEELDAAFVADIASTRSVKVDGFKVVNGAAVIVDIPIAREVELTIGDSGMEDTITIGNTECVKFNEEAGLTVGNEASDEFRELTMGTIDDNGVRSASVEL